MSLARKAIRARVRTVLLNNTDAADRVYANRVTPHFTTELPAIVIRTETEDVERVFEVEPRTYKRSLQLVIEILAEADSSLDDELDDLANAVQTLIEEDPNLNELCEECYLQQTSSSFVHNGDNLYGACVMRYLVEYYPPAIEPTP